MTDRFYAYRFELFLFTQLVILFGSILMPLAWFDSYIMPLFLLFNIGSGVLLVSKKKALSRVLAGFLAVSLLIILIDLFKLDLNKKYDYLKLASYFIFFAVVTIEIIRQVWKAKVVGKNVILGLISGYISLGLLAFFLCLTIEIIYPNSFSGLMIASGETDMSQDLMYFSYITLMTIGYGDILPVTSIAQKATIFIGLIGQFYLVILTAIVVGKYINQKNK